jgi:hypothetical protein
MSRSRHNSGSGITVGDIKNSTGVAIGQGAHVTVNPQPQPSAQDQVIALLDDFISSLDGYRDSLVDEQGVRRAVTEARAEAGTSSPKWQSVRDKLAAVAKSVAAVAALTEVITNIQALVAHLA